MSNNIMDGQHDDQIHQTLHVQITKPCSMNHQVTNYDFQSLLIHHSGKRIPLRGPKLKSLEIIYQLIPTELLLPRFSQSVLLALS